MSGIFQRALGCICTVFRICDCSTSRSHLNPGQVRKVTNLWEWAQTAMFDERDEQICSKIFTRCIPWDWMFVFCHCQSQCWTHITCRDVWDLDFKNWVVPWVFSNLNGLTLTQITGFFLSPKHVASHTKNACGARDLFYVCSWSQHREDQSLLRMWIGRISTKRDNAWKTTRKMTLSSMFISWHLWRITFKRSG